MRFSSNRRPRQRRTWRYRDLTRWLKTGLGAGAAWALGGVLLGIPDPYFAPLAVILTLQVTVAESLTHSVQRIVGIVLGVGLAFLVARVVGVDAWSIGIIVVASLALGGLLRLDSRTAAQVAISALLVMTVGDAVPGYEWRRVASTAVGVLVAVAVNAAIAPPTYLADVRSAITELAAQLGRVLEDLAAALTEEGAPTAPRALREARATRAVADNAREVLALEERSLKWNYFAGAERRTLRRYHRAYVRLERVGVMVRGIARSLSDMLAFHRGDASAGPLAGYPHLSEALSRFVETNARLVRRYAELAEKDSVAIAAGLAELRAEAIAAREDALRAASARPVALVAGPWTEVGQIIAQASRITRGLAKPYGRLRPDDPRIVERE